MRIPADAEERAIYVLDGDVKIAGDRFPSDRLLVFRPGDEIVVDSRAGRAYHAVRRRLARLEALHLVELRLVLAGAHRAGQEQEWKTGRFDIVPGDEEEFIPLPEG